jgi:hypothetical protein
MGESERGVLRVYIGQFLIIHNSQTGEGIEAERRDVDVVMSWRRYSTYCRCTAASASFQSLSAHQSTVISSVNGIVAVLYKYCAIVYRRRGTQCD